MRLSDLLGSEIVDQAGRSAGMVHDVRLVQDAPLVAGGLGPGLRLAWLVVGRRAVGARLVLARRQARLAETAKAAPPSASPAATPGRGG
jgi:hypothetical protein